MKQQIVTRMKPLALAILVAPAAALAVDGQILIDEAKAMAGNVTPGDSPGFPVTISEPGSYKLSGNLNVPDSNTSAIEITSNHVTLDLGGFAILGPPNCGDGRSRCEGYGEGVYTAGFYFNITVRNGTIQGMGRAGVELNGDSQLVEYMHVRGNGRYGIRIAQSPELGSSIAQHNTAQGNWVAGISVDRGIVTNNVADANTSGIFLSTGSASHNVATRNGRAGLELGYKQEPGNASYFGNTLRDNLINVLGGINLGQNLCTGTGGAC